VGGPRHRRPPIVVLVNDACAGKRTLISLNSTWRNNKKSTLNPKQSNVFGGKFRLREIRRIFPIKLSTFKLWKMPKLLNFRFPEG